MSSEISKEELERGERYMFAVYSYCEDNGIDQSLVTSTVEGEHIHLTIKAEVHPKHTDGIAEIAKKFEEGYSFE